MEKDDAILAKTAKGVREALGKTSALSRRMRNLLKEVDGKSSFGDLRNKLSDWPERELKESLEKLLGDSFIKEQAQRDPEIPPAPPAARGPGSTRRDASPPPLDADAREDLDFTTLLQRTTTADQADRKAAEEQARREAEERAKREAKEAARKTAEEQVRRIAEARARREAEERTKREAKEATRQAAEEQARREAEERAKQEAEAAARHAAEEQARRETEERAKREAEEQARREAEEQARREAEEQARREAEERAKREAEEQARREAEEQARREAEERAKREAEAAARQAAEEQARREAEERAKREAEEQAKREAVERAKREAEEQARREAEERERRAAMAMAGGTPRARPKWGKMLALASAVLAIAMAVLVNTLSFESRIPEFERIASAQIGQPVKIGALQASYLPRPQWRFEGVVIGAASQISVPRIIAEPRSYAELLGGSTTLASMRIEAPVVNAEGLDWLLFGKAQAPGGLATRSLVATQVRLELPGVVIPVFDARLDIGGDGNWQRIEIADAENGLMIELGAGDSMQVAIRLDKAALPLFRTPVFDDLSATGTLDRHGVRIGKFEGFSHGGTFSGSAALPWGSGASLAGTVSIGMLDMARVLPGLVETGRLAGEGSFSLPLGNKGLPQLAGSFSMDKATLNGIDFGHWLRGEGGGQTQFDTLTGTIRQQGGRTRLSQLSGDAGRLAVRGNAEIDEKGNASGRFGIDLNLGGERRRGTAMLRGSALPPYKELRWERR